MPSGVYDLDKIMRWGKSRKWCPYYLILRAINRQVVVGHEDGGGGASGNRFINNGS